MNFSQVYKKFIDISLIMGSFSIALISIFLIIYSFFDIGYSLFLSPSDLVDAFLHAIGLIVIAIANLDVAKYIVDEISRQDKIVKPSDARKTLTKFIIIIFVAISLEVVLGVFFASKEDFSLLIYPAILLFVNVLLLVGLGFFQKISAEADKKCAESQ